MSQTHKQPTLVQNAGDEAQVQKAEQEEKERLKRKQNEIRAVMGSKEGRGWIWRILDRCGIWHEPIVNEEMTYYNCGVQSVGHSIANEIKAATFEGWQLMEKEAMEKQA